MDPLPSFGVSDPNTIARVALEKELALVHAVFGSDLDAVILSANDPNTKQASKCQVDAIKATQKCQDAKLKEFNKCKKAGLKDASITNLSGLEACMGADPKEKILQACVTKLGDKLQKKCTGTSIEAAFPGDCSDSADLNALTSCLDMLVECGVCLALNEVDALGRNCDLFDDGQANQSCVIVRGDTFQIPSAAQPAETPGTPGVVVDPNSSLLTQFDDPNFSLNNVHYTRWRFDGPEQTPDAILIVVAGFGGGANGFKILIENLIIRMLKDHDLVLEVWGFHRRSNQLEDRGGALIADALGNPLVALDWYYGAELGLTLHPALAAGPNRRATFYNTSDDIPFLANWTSQVFSQDIDAVVDVARGVARNSNVFLGGHSAGTGFTGRYAATDFNLTGVGDPQAGYAKLKGLVLFEGHAGRTGSALSADSLDRIEAKFDGGLFGAVRDNAPRCVDGTTACTIETEADDCLGQEPPKCTLPTQAYAAVDPLNPKIVASSEPSALQGRSDHDSGQVILQVDQGTLGNSAVLKVPELAVLGLLPPATVDALFGAFLDDEGLNPSAATGLGAPGPNVDDLATWLEITEGPLPASFLPDNGPKPTTLDPNSPDLHWGQEKEAVRLDRMRTTFLAAESNAADWYYAASGLSVTSAPGVCDNDPNDGSFLCTAGNVSAACSDDGDCAQSISLDSSALSVDRGRRDIVNLTQAANIDIPVICFGGSNGNTPVPASYVPFAESIGPCDAPSCDPNTPRLVDPNLPNEAFPTFGDVEGGFEVHISEGFAHNDVTTAEDNADNNVLGPLSNFIARNTQ